MKEIHYKTHLLKIGYLRRALSFIFLIKASLRIETLYKIFMFFLDRGINNYDSKNNLNFKIKYQKKNIL